MNIIEHGKQFVQHLIELVNRPAWDWRRCHHCESTKTVRNDGRRVHPRTLEGRIDIHIQRHWCYSCKGSYSEESPFWDGSHG